MVFNVINNTIKRENLTAEEILESRKNGWNALEDVDKMLSIDDHIGRINTLSSVALSIIDEMKSKNHKWQSEQFNNELYYVLQLLVDEKSYLAEPGNGIASDVIPEGDFTDICEIMNPYLQYLSTIDSEQGGSVYKTLDEVSWCLRSLMMGVFWIG